MAVTWAARAWWVRTLGVLVILGWALLGTVAVMLFGVASTSGGWLWSALVFAPGAAGGAALLGVGPVRAAVAAVAALSLTGGALAYQAAPPDHARIRTVAEKALASGPGLAAPAVHESGNTWCFKGCPEVEYAFTGPRPADAVVAEIAATLRADGWRGGPVDPNPHGRPSKYDPVAFEVWRKGRWTASVRAPSAATRRWDPHFSASTSLVTVQFSRS